MRRGGVILPFFLGGCSGVQTMLGGEGAEGANFIQLFTVFMIVCTVMYLIVAIALIAAVWRRRNAALTLDNRRHHESSSAVRPALIGWTALIAVGLIGLTVASFFTDRSNAANGNSPQLSLTVTVNQWWWDVEYNSPDASKTVRTANEIHLPVGVPVEVKLKSNDVIHSFWIPNLAGKQDLIPGRETDAQLLPRKTGLYRGQCAEFCGMQHAHMAFDVIAESQADFDRWLSAMRRPASPPATPETEHGREVFDSARCAGCHAVEGTGAAGLLGPNLTHIATRSTLGAGTLANTPEHLAAWIRDPQTIKPGNQMPANPMSDADLQALVAYLETLR